MPPGRVEVQICTQFGDDEFAVKEIDIFGNDTMTLVLVNVGSSNIGKYEPCWNVEFCRGSATIFSYMG
jgi:hypothetical protein